MAVSNDVTGLVLTGGVALLCLALGIMLYRGHGAMLIAGYNTMPKHDREKINEKALLKAVGSYMMAISLWLVLVMLAAMQDIQWLVFALIGLMLVITIAFMVYINKSKRFKKERIP